MVSAALRARRGWDVGGGRFRRSRPRTLRRRQDAGVICVQAPSGFSCDRYGRAGVVTTAIAASPPGPYFNGFETDTAGWFNLSGATITRRPSGYTTGVGGYASGISSADGSYHARLGKDTSPDSCTFGGGTASIFYGPYTKWGGYSSIFPTAGYKTRVDIYLDVPWAQAHPDTRFDWSSAISDASGGFRRDFVFNVGTDALGFVMTGGNNATRCGANPSDPGHAPVAHVTTSGWYTFEHHFTGVVGGPLVVNLSVIEKTSNVVVGTWTRADPTDIIGVTVGGNRYGWFVQNEIDQLAIDNSERTGLVSTIGFFCRNGRNTSARRWRLRSTWTRLLSVATRKWQPPEIRRGSRSIRTTVQFSP